MPDAERFFPYVYADTVTAAATVLPAVSTILIALRFYVRRAYNQGIAIDDWLLIPAVLVVWGMGAVVLRGTTEKLFGYPTPIPEDPASYNKVFDLLPGQAEFFHLQYVFIALSVLAFGLIKLAVLFFYRRIFVVKDSAFNVVSWIAIVLSVMWTITFFIGQLAVCGATPSSIWGSIYATLRDCVDTQSFYIAMASTDLATDLLAFFLPFPLIWKLQMPLRKKLSVSLIFALGALSLVGSAIRLAVQVRILAVGLERTGDYFLTLTIGIYWGMIEAGVALIVINIPTLGRLLRARSESSKSTGWSSKSYKHVRGNSGEAWSEATVLAKASTTTSEERRRLHVAELEGAEVHDMTTYNRSELV